MKHAKEIAPIVLLVSLFYPLSLHAKLKLKTIGRISIPYRSSRRAIRYMEDEEGRIILLPTIQTAEFKPVEMRDVRWKLETEEIVPPIQQPFSPTKQHTAVAEKSAAPQIDTKQSLLQHALSPAHAKNISQSLPTIKH